jgi:nucleoside-diphosphate-sugar epimerase
MKVLIAGCGYVGTALGAEWVKAGHEVWGMRRDLDAARSLEKSGIQPVVANMLRPETLKEIPSVDAVVLCQAPSKKNDEYRGTYFEATRNLLEALEGQAIRRLLLVSSTSVYATMDGSWVNEATEPMAGSHADAESRENAKILLSQESLVLGSKFPSIIFRLAGIYGPGRNRVRSILDGRVKPALSDIYMNRIHLADIVRGIRLLMEKGVPGQIYIGADDGPCTQREFYTWVYERLSTPLPKSGAGEPAHGSNKRCSNEKLKALGLRLRYPTYKEGYQPLIDEALRQTADDVRRGDVGREGWIFK